MTTDELRAKFENWWLRNGDPFDLHKVAAWASWQAAHTSRDAEVENLRDKLRISAQPPAAGVPDVAECPAPDQDTGEDHGPCCAHAYADGWNDCRDAMLATTKPETEE